MLGWFIALITPDRTLSIGTSVQTSYGPGKITGGAVNVALDTGFKPPTHARVNPGKHANVTVNLEDINLL
jgi:hypothetical protein